MKQSTIQAINFLFRFSFLKKFILNFLVNNEGYDFIDFGSKTGGSILYAQKVFHLNKGLGIDLLKNFPTLAFKNNFVGLKTDILKLPNIKYFDAVIMSHFLEHIPCRNTSLKMIEKSLTISKKFIYIQQPFFDENMYLFKNDLKLCYADWHGHHNMLTSYDFYIMLKQLQLTYKFHFTIAVDYLIPDSGSLEIVNIDEKIDTLKFDKEKSLTKNDLVFKQEIYREIKILITHFGINHDEQLKMMRYKKILKKQS